MSAVYGLISAGRVRYRCCIRITYYLANRVGRRLQSQYRVNGLVVSGDKGGKTSIDAALLSTLLASASRRVIQTY